MKKVLSNCTGDVVEECGKGKGCADGACVDACTAAEVSKGSAGCHFWTLPPDEIYGQGSCFAAMVANTWDRPVNVTAAFGESPLDLSQSIFTVEMKGTTPTYTKLDGPLPSGEVAVVFLSQQQAASGDAYFSRCPAGAVGAYDRDPSYHGTGRTKAFSITTDAPVSAYSIYPYGGASTYFPTATLLLPTSAWSTNYLAINAWTYISDPSYHVFGYPTLQVVATEPDTEVRIRPKVDVADGNGLVGGAAGQLLTWKLGRGEVLQIVQVEELTGSAIESDKPIGMFGGNRCTRMPSKDFDACDALQQQIAPISQWGSSYALVPYHSREGARLENVPYRLVGAASGTVLSYDPARPLGAPETLDAGQVATFMTDQLVLVRSQDADHPFYAAHYMTGANYAKSGTSDGDPDFVNVVPAEQYLDHYVFFADYTYPNSTLTLVRRKTDKGFMPVELDCVGEVGGFAPLGKGGEFEYAWVDLTKNFASATGVCGPGRHEAKSDGPFSLTVWGTGDYASYGYAGGTGSRPITKVEIPVK
ncbi:hypothetical protein AKJ09_01518 [Labilithrix luteola]|uniref:IgGFc-binding protein N-terminal domain-containing protein n=2 Tax=Labilithrix luteola TaxID=1391654 RepID=A0A0K1PP11_9BACT|nr:hypothetical protein AKJ09_01518 [Labilithrix luteola]